MTMFDVSSLCVMCKQHPFGKLGDGEFVEVRLIAEIDELRERAG